MSTLHRPSRRRLISTLTIGALCASGFALSASPAYADDSSLEYGAPGYAEGDLTGDSKIDADDLAILTAAIGATTASDSWSTVAAADLNDDGLIDVTDVTTLSQKIVYDDGALELLEASVLDIQKAMAAGSTSSVDLVTAYLDRIAAYDKTTDASGNSLSSIISTNGNALAEAAALDAERAESGPRSMLHGIPVIVKDNYNTVDMATTAGCGCLSDNVTDTDATMVAQLKEAGAIIIAKANLSEFAIQNTTSISYLGGTTKNVFRLDRSPGGSSGGTASAIAANFGVIGLGTDTGGSIRIPSAWASLVGLRPTVGLASRDGIIPLALSQDTGGPITRSVADAAVALDFLTGYDAADPITAESEGSVPATYTAYLDEDGLVGKRIGYLPGYTSGDAQSPAVRLTNRAIADVTAAGAEVVTLPTTAVTTAIDGSSGSTNEFKHDLNQYLAKFIDPDFTMTQLIARGNSSVTSTLTSRNNVTQETYDSWMITHGADQADARATVDALMEQYDLDALMYPSASGSPTATSGTAGNMNRLSAYTGYPAISVPMGFADSTIDSTSHSGTSMGIEFLGTKFGEGDLISIAYAYEQSTKYRHESALFPALSNPVD